PPAGVRWKSDGILSVRRQMIGELAPGSTRHTHVIERREVHTTKTFGLWPDLPEAARGRHFSRHRLPDHPDLRRVGAACRPRTSGSFLRLIAVAATAISPAIAPCSRQEPLQPLPPL